MKYCGCGRKTHKGACWFRRIGRAPQRPRKDKGTGMTPTELRAYKTQKQREYRGKVTK